MMTSIRVKPRLFMRGVAMLLVTAGCCLGGDASPAPDRHLFILSGQSNMTPGLKGGFANAVAEHYGKENVAIAAHSKNGRGIRFWDQEYTYPDGYIVKGKKKPPTAGSLAQHGEDYIPLMKSVRKAGDSKSFKTVTFVWMQGESDAGRDLGPFYAASFTRVLNRLKADTERSDINFVIGRVSDAGLGGPNEEGWKHVRAIQMKLADDAEYGAWINTDDLNGPDNDVHYPREQCGILGARFAEKAIELVAKRLEVG